jgi:hypothetical protein
MRNFEDKMGNLTEEIEILRNEKQEISGITFTQENKDYLKEL